MNSWKNNEEFFTSYLDKMEIEIDLWVEIITNQPKCTYYFGPFTSANEAQISQSGYIEDLEQEEAKVIGITIKQDQPRELTIFEDELGHSCQFTSVKN